MDFLLEQLIEPALLFGRSHRGFQMVVCYWSRASKLSIFSATRGALISKEPLAMALRMSSTRWVSTTDALAMVASILCRRAAVSVRLTVSRVDDLPVSCCCTGGFLLWMTCSEAPPSLVLIG